MVWWPIWDSICSAEIQWWFWQICIFYQQKCADSGYIRNFTYYYSQDFLGKILDTKTHNVISLPKLCDISGYKTGFYLHTATENKKGVSCTQTCCSHVIQNTKHVLLYLMLCMVFRWLFNIIICHYCVSKTTKELITLYIGKKKTKPNTSQGLKVC